MGPLLDARWRPLGLENAARLGLDPQVVERWLPPPPDLRARRAPGTRGVTPGVRIASSQVDQNSQVMLERQGVKLVWRDQSRDAAALRYLCFDLDRDPGETDDLWPARAPAAARSLEPQLRQLSDDAAWGVEVSFTGSDSTLPFVFRGQLPMRQAWVPPGGHPRAFEFRFMFNELRWTPVPGERIFVRLNPGSLLWLVPAADGQDAEQAQGLVLWPATSAGLPAEVPLSVRAVGPTRFEHGGAEPVPQPSAEVIEALRALGYVQ
jgi:hypothetical protein